LDAGGTIMLNSTKNAIKGQGGVVTSSSVVSS